MLYRKIEAVIYDHLTGPDNRILLVEGARQVGKSFIIRKVGREIFPNFIEINLLEDFEGVKSFGNVKSIEDFYLHLSAIAPAPLGKYSDTLVFLDEIQVYPYLLTLLKFLREDRRYRFIASGSLLGLALHQTVSIPVGSIRILKMYPLDFDEFMIANHVGQNVIEYIRECYAKKTSLTSAIHGRIMDLFRKYLISGGLPEAVKAFIDRKNVVEVRDIQSAIHRLYEADASQYDKEHRLKIERIYRLVPSVMESKKKRIVLKDIENKIGSRYSTYAEEFDYLIDSGITLEVKAVTGPRFPLIESGGKNLLKLYLNDVGMLTGTLYRTRIGAILDDEASVNLGAVYESVVAQELSAHGFNLYYYDNKKNGEVDYLIDDFENLCVLPIEVKSGKDYTIHSALSRFVNNPDYNVHSAIVFCNTSQVTSKDKIWYMPIYFVSCLHADPPSTDILI